MFCLAVLAIRSNALPRVFLVWSGLVWPGLALQCLVSPVCLLWPCPVFSCLVWSCLVSCHLCSSCLDSFCLVSLSLTSPRPASSRLSTSCVILTFHVLSCFDCVLSWGLLCCRVVKNIHGHTNRGFCRSTRTRKARGNSQGPDTNETKARGNIQWPARTVTDRNEASARRDHNLLFPTKQVVTLPGACHWKVSAETGWPGVSILWLGEIENVICTFCLSVAKRTIVFSDPSLRYTSIFHTFHLGFGPSTAGCSPPSMPSVVFCLLLSCFTFHLGFVHPLQDVALHQCLPLSSVCCFPVSPFT